MFNLKKGLWRTVALSIWAALLFIALPTLLILHLPTPKTPLQQATSSVVEIRTQVVDDESGSLVPDGSGSGVIVDRRGYILTCWHVVNGAVATVVAHDPDLDLALIQVGREMKHVTTWGDSDLLQPGDSVFAIGYPYDLARLVRRGVIASTDFIIADGSFVVTDASVNPGDSGGGLFTESGQLIGIDARIQSVQGLAANIGIAYAITGNVAHWFVTHHLPTN